MSAALSLCEVRDTFNSFWTPRNLAFFKHFRYLCHFGDQSPRAAFTAGCCNVSNVSKHAQMSAALRCREVASTFRGEPTAHKLALFITLLCDFH